MLRNIIKNNKFVIFLSMCAIIAGLMAIRDIPKESSPDVEIPNIGVTVTQEGISPEDAETLLIKPIEREVDTIEGVEEIRSTASEGSAVVRIEFSSSTDMDQALDDVKDAVDSAKADFPDDANEPVINEVNVSLFPIISVGIYGEIPYGQMVKIGRDLQDDIERVHNVFEVDMIGDLDDIIEINLNMKDISALKIDPVSLVSELSSNNTMINSGDIKTTDNKISIKIPGLIESTEDIENFPIFNNGKQVITLGDISEIKWSNRDRESAAYINEKPAVTLEISKRIGSSIMDVITDSKKAVDDYHLPEGVSVVYMQDQSEEITDMLSNLSNNVILTVIIVFIIMSMFMNIRSAVLVGLTVPLSFLMAFIVLNAMGSTANTVVLFGLIMVTGMLVDSAIVVAESADTMKNNGVPPKIAYVESASRMASPIISSALTTMAAFFPLIFWPGTTGEFMKHLPITVLITLTCSLFVSIIVLPSIAGSLSGKKKEKREKNKVKSNTFKKIVIKTVRYSKTSICIAIASIFVIGGAYKYLNNGVEFFPKTDADFLQVEVFKEGSHTLSYMESHVREIEDTLLDIEGIETIYTSISESNDDNSIGMIRVDLVDWEERKTSDEIKKIIRNTIDEASLGIDYEMSEKSNGPSSGKPISIQLMGSNLDELNQASTEFVAKVQALEGTVDASIERKDAGKEWKIDIDRQKASAYGVDIQKSGAMITMLTSGLKVTTINVDGHDDDIDVLARLSESERNAGNLKNLNILNDDQQYISLNSISEIVEGDKVASIKRLDMKRTMKIESNVEAGYQTDAIMQKIKTEIAPDIMGKFETVDVVFKGENEDSAETMAFMMSAFLIAIGLMMCVLLQQFNSFRKAIIVFFAVVFSVFGVLAVLMLLGQPFGVVFSGLAILSLAGISINHNIILIDEFNDIRATRNCTIAYAAVKAASNRFRPIMLTVLTTSIGLLPMMFEISVDFINMDITVGDPSMAMWSQLASNIAGGLFFSALISLLVTPALITVFHRDKKKH